MFVEQKDKHDTIEKKKFVDENADSKGCLFVNIVKCFLVSNSLLLLENKNYGFIAVTF